jgi:hypothetical protein
MHLHDNMRDKSTSVLERAKTQRPDESYDNECVSKSLEDAYLNKEAREAWYGRRYIMLMS